jgi:hypothetical protein
VLALALVLSTAMAGGVFASEGETLSSEEFGAMQRASGEIEGQGAAGANALGTSGAEAEGINGINGIDAIDADAVPAVRASGYSFPSFNPQGGTYPIAEAGNAAALSSTHAGGSITATFVGVNQDAFFASCDIVDSSVAKGNPALIPALGTVALIPTDYEDSLAHSQGYYRYYDYTFSNDYSFSGPQFTYTDDFKVAGPMWVKVYYQKWTVVQNTITTTTGAVIVNTTQPAIWQPDTTVRYVQQFDFNLLGMVNYVEYERGKTFRTVWVAAGTKLPKLTPKRKGFKFGGWYTDWPKGSKVKVGSATASFGGGYEQTLYVHWKKKVKITYNPKGGKITKGKKTVTVNYLGKVGKAPTTKRSGYSGLGWYYRQKYTDSYGNSKTDYKLHERSIIVNVPKATFYAEWLKNGSKKTVSASEWERILKAYEKGLIIKYKAVKAAIGGNGMYNGETDYYVGTDGRYNYYIRCKVYEWNGTTDGTVVRMYFSVKTGNLIDGARTGGLE